MAEGVRGERPGGGGGNGQGLREGGRRTCLHLFQRAQRWVVTSRVGRHGNLLGLPKRGSIVLPVKTARDPDPAGSPMHMDSRRVATGRKERGWRGDSPSLERKSSVPPPLKPFVIIEREDVRPADRVMMFRAAMPPENARGIRYPGSHASSERSKLLINDDARVPRVNNALSVEFPRCSRRHRIAGRNPDLGIVDW